MSRAHSSNPSHKRENMMPGFAPLARLRDFLRAGALALLLIGSGAFAQTVDVPVRYTVRPGDTLLSLARVYMTAMADYLTVQKLNSVKDPRHIPIGDTLVIPRALLKTEPLIGTISSFRGGVTVNGQAAALGTKVQQGMRIETGASAFVTLTLPDASAISLPSQSRLYVERLTRILLTGTVDRSFRLEAGRSQSTVTPIKDPASNFRVTTPLSVSAVRGTDFRVAVDPANGRALTEVVGGTVGVAAEAGKPETPVLKSFGIVATASGLDSPMALLPAPKLLTVEKTADGAIITSKPITGAKGYRIQLATDVRFHDVFDEKVSDKPSASFTLAADKPFFIRLTAIADSGLEGLPGTYALGRSAPLEGGGGPSGASARIGSFYPVGNQGEAK